MRLRRRKIGALQTPRRRCIDPSPWMMVEVCACAQARLLPDLNLDNRNFHVHIAPAMPHEPMPLGCRHVFLRACMA